MKSERHKEFWGKCLLLFLIFLAYLTMIILPIGIICGIICICGYVPHMDMEGWALIGALVLFVVVYIGLRN